MAAIRICAEVVRIDIEWKMRWRVKGERGDYRSFDLWTSRHAQIGILASMRQRRKDDFPLGEETIDRVTTLAGELVVALRGGTQDDDALYDLMSEGGHDATSEEEGPFSVDAAHLIAMIEDFMRSAAELERKVGQLDRSTSTSSRSTRLGPGLPARRRAQMRQMMVRSAARHMGGHEARALQAGARRRVERGGESRLFDRLALCCSCRAERATALTHASRSPSAPRSAASARFSRSAQRRPVATRGRCCGERNTHSPFLSLRSHSYLPLPTRANIAPSRQARPAQRRMEIEPRGRKRRQQEEEARRGARNPVRRDVRGHYEVDQQEIARPEYQELLEALYTHYERGARAPLP